MDVSRSDPSRDREKCEEIVILKALIENIAPRRPS